MADKVVIDVGDNKPKEVAHIDSRTWEDVGLTPDLLKGVYDYGYYKPSKIQAAAIPLIVSKYGKAKNLIGQAQNGSGKTAAFALGILLNVDYDLEVPQAICLCPTRELARQNQEVIMSLGKYTKVKVGLVVPQANLDDIDKSNVLVATPGKMLEMIQKQRVSLNSVTMFILDEADVMLHQEQQMAPQVNRIHLKCPKDIQFLFFSATYPDMVRNFASKIIPGAAKISLEKEELTVEDINQTYILCKKEGKYDQLTSLYAAMSVGQSIIFVNSRNAAFDLANQMQEDGHAVSLICGGSSQTQQTSQKMDTFKRDEVMREFRHGVTKVLIATDVLSRGVDIPQVTLVVNYDLPVNHNHPSEPEYETYLHRIGRTGRFGLKGIAVSLVYEREQNLIDKIETFYTCKIAKTDPAVEDLEKRISELRV